VNRPLTWLLRLLTLHTAVNALLLRRTRPQRLTRPVSVVLPVRDEATQVGGCLRALLADPDLAEVVVVDDGSADGTAQVVRSFVDPRVRLVTAPPVPPGWLGKSHACWLGAREARHDVLVFVDADVTVHPGGLGGAVAALEHLDLACPYPRQHAPGATGLVQPLLQWSILTFLPLRLAERGPAALSAGNGQVLIVTRAAYERAGTHRAVATDPVEDVALVRAVKATGGRAGVVDGTRLATTTMYADLGAAADGYAKVLSATPPVVPLLLAVLYLRRGAYLLGVAGRLISAARTGGSIRAAWAHPLSVLLWCCLDVRARVLRRRGRLRWKDRVL
jgi:glycosyltransferase involved in cell wall biosynthesis